MALNVQRGYPLGLDISTSELADNAVSVAKLTHHTGEGVQVFDAAGVPVILDGGAANEAVKMNAGGTALEFGTGGAVSVLGSGYFETSGAGVNNVGNFAVGADIGNGIIVFEAVMNRYSGAGTTNNIGLAASAGGAIIADYATGNKTTQSQLMIKMQQVAKTAAQLDLRKEIDGATSVVTQNTNFNTTAAVTFHISSLTGDASVLKIRWIAYLINA